MPPTPCSSGLPPDPEDPGHQPRAPCGSPGEASFMVPSLPPTTRSWELRSHRRELAALRGGASLRRAGRGADRGFELDGSKRPRGGSAMRETGRDTPGHRASRGPDGGLYVEQILQRLEDALGFLTGGIGRRARHRMQGGAGVGPRPPRARGNGVVRAAVGLRRGLDAGGRRGVGAGAGSRSR